MKLKSIEFYQSVRLWDNREAKTVDLGTVSSIELVDHLVELSMVGQDEVIVVPTANMRHGRVLNMSTQVIAPLIKEEIPIKAIAPRSTKNTKKK